MTPLWKGHFLRFFAHPGHTGKAQQRRGGIEPDAHVAGPAGLHRLVAVRLAAIRLLSVGLTRCGIRPRRRRQLRDRSRLGVGCVVPARPCLHALRGDGGAGGHSPGVSVVTQRLHRLLLRKHLAARTAVRALGQAGIHTGGRLRGVFHAVVIPLLGTSRRAAVIHLPVLSIVLLPATSLSAVVVGIQVAVLLAADLTDRRLLARGLAPPVCSISVLPQTSHLWSWSLSAWSVFSLTAPQLHCLQCSLLPICQSP